MKKNLCGVLLAVMVIVLAAPIVGGTLSEGSSILPWGLYQEALRWQSMGEETGVPCEALLFILAEPVEDHHIERLIEAGYAVSGVFGRFVSVLAPITLYIDEKRGADALGFVLSTLPELGIWHHMEWSGWSDEQLAACMATSLESPEGAEEEKTWDDAIQLFEQGITAYGQARFQDAIELFEEALAIVQQLGRRAAEGTILRNPGSCYKCLSAYQQGIDYHEQAAAICREIGYRLGEALNLGNLARCYQSLLLCLKCLCRSSIST